MDLDQWQRLVLVLLPGMMLKRSALMPIAFCSSSTLALVTVSNGECLLVTVIVINAYNTHTRTMSFVKKNVDLAGIVKLLLL